MMVCKYSKPLIKCCLVKQTKKKKIKNIVLQVNRSLSNRVTSIVLDNKALWDQINVIGFGYAYTVHHSRVVDFDICKYVAKNVDRHVCSGWLDGHVLS